MRKKTAAQEVLRPDANFRHIAFIMDGNGRWAKKRGMPREYGHKVGSATFKKVCLYCCDIGFQAVTVYAFSTENWKRPPHEVETIMGILDDYLEELKRDYPKYHNRFRFIGDLSVLTPALREKIAYVETLNAQEPQVLNIALNYGGRAELLRAARALAEQVRSGALDPADIDEAKFDAELYTAGQPPVDLLIRTSGEQRLSNFLPWQTVYAEMVFDKTCWPDFDRAAYLRALREFAGRSRRFGGV